MPRGDRPGEAILSAETILAAARSMLPDLRARAAATEANRRLLPEFDRRFREAGFYRVMQPRGFGGLELPFGIQTDLSIELARACPSSGWVTAILACHAWMLGMLPGEAQADVWGENPDTTVASSFLNRAPRVERAAGGLRLSGRWEFSSGVDYCDWVMVLARAPAGDGGPPAAFFALVPLSDCRIEDCWNAVGLAGTGSNDLILEDVFVPDHRLGSVRDMCDGNGPGRAVNDGYLYRLPQLAVFSFNLVGTVIGAARGALEAVVEAVADKRSFTGVGVARQQSVQLRVAESLADIDAGFALIDRNRHEIIAWGEAGDIPPLEQRARYRRDNGYAARVCCRAIDRILPLTGAGGLAADDPVNRAWRDAHAVARHIALTWDVQGAIHGAVALGQPCPDPFV